MPPTMLDTVGWQAALDRAGFSPGIIDGIMGPKTRMGLRTFQEFNGLPVTDLPDDATLAGLGAFKAPALRRYVLTKADAAAVGPHPTKWLARSKLDRLAYQSLAVLAAERGHCTRKLLALLNPRVNLDRLKPGDAIIFPNVASPSWLRGGRDASDSTDSNGAAAWVEVDFRLKMIRVIDEAGRVGALFHCSIARDRSNLPGGPCLVKTIAMNPTYTFDPAKWPEVKDVNRRLLIPPGPRNPVGVCWIGLSLAGYGIHGTPKPELIGKTGSHGCIRLTNWDAVRLSRIVRVGTKVRFIQSNVGVARAR